MPNYNKIILIGHVTRDPELRYTPQGKAVAKCGIAVNTHRGEGKDDEVLFIDFDIWDKQAESLAKHVTKGQAILIEGRLKLDKWQDKATGQERSKHAITVMQWSFMGGKPEDKTKPSQPAPGHNPNPQPKDGDDVPF